MIGLKEEIGNKSALNTNDLGYWLKYMKWNTLNSYYGNRKENNRITYEGLLLVAAQ